jgi:protein O-GlcNAc transferase
VIVDLQFQEAITNITKSEKAKFIDLMEAQALSLFKNSRYSEAEKIYLTLLRSIKNNSSVWYNLGTLYYEQGENFKAFDCLNKALIIDDSQAPYHYIMGLILEKIQINKAIEAYQKAIEIDPKLVDAYNNLGNIFLVQGEVEQAEIFFRKAVTANPLHFGSYLNLGNLLIEQYQQVDEAISYYQKAFNFNPNDPNILNNLSVAYSLKDNHESQVLFYQGFYFHTLGNFTEAIGSYKQAISITPESKLLYFHLGLSWHSIGKTEAAIQELKLALKLFPNDLLIQIAILQMLPAIYQTIEEIDFYRECFRERLELLVKNISLDTDSNRVNALKAISQKTNFYLAYQCKNDVNLQKGGKIKVGYISSHLYNHNGANWSLGWIKNHNRDHFEIYCYHVGVKTDHITEQFQLYSNSFVHIPKDLAAICKQVISDNLHILVFPAIGMEIIDGQLSALRLAPVQCTAWGHPVTSGLPTVDYYLSSELMESENAQEHYSEQLIRLPNIGLCYSKPILPELKNIRSDFGLPEDSIVYLCCQSTFKYLPQYDYIFPSIAKQVKKAKFVFIAALEGKYITEQFRQRLDQEFTKFCLNSEDYCVILPRQKNQYDFLQLNLISDIFLDTFGWNGGNTTLQAIACNLPVVTCPGEFMRGRHSYGFLKMLGVNDTIANSEAEYIDIAVKLGLDAAMRTSIAAKISQNHNRLFDDKTCVEGLEAFYKEVVQEKLSLIL